MECTTSIGDPVRDTLLFQSRHQWLLRQLSHVTWPWATSAWHSTIEDWTLLEDENDELLFFSFNEWMNEWMNANPFNSTLVPVQDIPQNFCNARSVSTVWYNKSCSYAIAKRDLCVCHSTSVSLVTYWIRPQKMNTSICLKAVNNDSSNNKKIKKEKRKQTWKHSDNIAIGSHICLTKSRKYSQLCT